MAGQSPTETAAIWASPASIWNEDDPPLNAKPIQIGHQMTLEALQARLTAAEDRLAIIDLEAEYSRAWDSGDETGWASVFTPQGVFELSGAGAQPPRIVQGADALAAFCKEVNAFYRGLHFTTVPRLELNDNRARGQVHFQWLGLFRQGETFSGQRRAAGYYDVTYEKTGGAWRMARRVETQISGDLSEAFDPFIKVSLR